MMNFIDLDDLTRARMFAEFKRDLTHDQLSVPKRLTEEGQRRFPGMLVEAIEAGDERSLAEAVRPYLHERELRGERWVAMPSNAAQVLATDEFNRYYIRAICVRAIDEARGIEVYRAREVEAPRVNSERLIGVRPNPMHLLADLRMHTALDNELRIPGGPNSGISVRFVR